MLFIVSLSFISIYFNGFCNFIYTKGSSPQHVLQLKQHLLTLDYLAYGSVNRFASLATASCIYDKVVEKQTSHLKAVITINSQRPQGWHCSADRHKDKQRERLCRCHTVTSGGFVFPHAAQFRIELYAFRLDFYTDRKGFPKESCLIYALNMTN